MNPISQETYKDFDCHFVFETIIQTHGTDEEGARENLSSFFPPEVKKALCECMMTETDFLEEVAAKEVYNGWYELTLTWSGYYFANALNEAKAREIAASLLDSRLTAVYRFLETMSDKNRRFQFVDLNNEKITDIL